MLRLICRTKQSRQSIFYLRLTRPPVSSNIPNDCVLGYYYNRSLSSTSSSLNSEKQNDEENKKHSFSSVSSTAITGSHSDDVPESSLSSSVNDIDSLKRLMELSKPEWPLVAMSAATLAVTSSITLLLPFASGQVIDYTINAGSDGYSPLVLASGLFGLSAVAGGGVYLRSLWLARAGNRIVARLKQCLYGSILHQESAYIDQKVTTGDLISRLTSDAQLIQSALTTQVVAGLRGSVVSMGSAGMLLYTSPTLAAVSCCTLPPIFILTRQVGRELKKQQSEVQKMQGEATTFAEQALTNMNTVKQFAGEGYETVRYQNSIANAHSKAYETSHMQAQLEAGAHIAGNAAILGVLGYGGSLVVDGSITAGDLTGFVMYSLLMAGNLSSLTSVYADLTRAMGASQRVLEILDRDPKIQNNPAQQTIEKSGDEINHTLQEPEYDPLDALDYTTTMRATTKTTPAITASSIEIRDLNFRYPSRPEVPILNNFNLTVAPGEVVALVGGSGSGKTTIGSLLTRLYDPENKDSICIDGKPVADYDLHELRRDMIGIVSQEPALFRGSIRDNIRYGQWGRHDNDNDYEDRIVEAARLAHVLDFAQKFPDGLDTMVGARGMELSGGQRQRIALARVLAKDAPIIVLDEATSALDAQSEHLVQLALQSIFHESGRTIISIAHRLSTIRHSSRIAVVEQGSVVQTGTFEELRSTDGPFRNLMKTQLIGDI